MSTEPTWRVYLPEWLTVYTSDFAGEQGEAEVLQHFRARYEGRVREQDWRIAAVEKTWRALELRLPNRRGEFKDYNDAVKLASELVDGLRDGLCVVVQRGSDEEQVLLDYGKKMLPDAR